MVFLMLDLVFVPLARAGDLYERDYVAYWVDLPQATVIDGIVVDAETGVGIGGAMIGGEVHSEVIPIEVRADQSGRFRIVLPNELATGEHAFALKGSAVGYDNRIVAGKIIKGETKHVRLELDYNPFDLVLGESSGTLERGWSAYTYYSGSTAWAFHDWKDLGMTLSANDPNLSSYQNNQNYDLRAVTERVKVKGGYWKIEDVYGWGNWYSVHSWSKEVDKGTYDSQAGDWKSDREWIDRYKWVNYSYDTTYTYKYTEYRRHMIRQRPRLRRLISPVGWSRWYYGSRGTETFDRDKGASFTTGGRIYESWKRDYSYSKFNRVLVRTYYYIGYTRYRRDWVKTGTEKIWVDPVYEPRTT